MLKKKILLLPFLGLMVFLISCENLFNPSGKADNTSLDADGLIAQGELQLRQGENYDALQTFSLAIAKDSTKSMAYFGRAKAIFRLNNVNPIEVLDIIGQSQATSKKDSTQSPVGTIGNFLITKIRDSNDTFVKGIEEMSKSLESFFRRDSVNNLWRSYKKYQDSNGRGLTVQELKEYALFNKVYREEAKGGYSIDQFPIMDGRVTSARLVAEKNIALALQMMKTVSSLFASYGDVTKISSDLTDLAQGKKELADLEVFQKAMTDTALSKTLNDNISNLANDATKLESVAANFAQVTGQDKGKVDSVSKDSSFQKQIAELGPSINFYKIKDKLDNDGDGCVDEEFYDKVDNDGDGLIDEDSRGTPPTPLNPADDAFDNDHNGVVDDANELLDAQKLLLYTAITGFKGTQYTDKTLKLAIASDTALPYKYPISERVKLIGACWRNYK